MSEVENLLGKAVQHFWRTRTSQHERQGADTGVKDAGKRGAVTGGKHADGFATLIASIVANAGCPEMLVHTTVKKMRTLPGFFRPCKEWDVVVISGNDIVAAIEVKSQVGSFGNNFNNRVEEAVGNATDFWTAYKKGIFEPSARPWLGYLFMLEEHPTSIRETRRVVLKPFPLQEEFQELSYGKRYEVVCLRLVRELLYDAACFITSNQERGIQGQYSQPNSELSIQNFAISLHARVSAFSKMKGACS